MLDRLGDTPKYESDPHSRAEHHGKPGCIAEFRFVIGLPQTDAAKPAEEKKKYKKKEQNCGNCEHPTEVFHNCGLNPIKNLFG